MAVSTDPNDPNFGLETDQASPNFGLPAEHKEEGGVVSGILSGLGHALNPVTLIKGALNLGEPSDISKIYHYGKSLTDIVGGKPVEESLRENVPEVAQAREAAFGHQGAKAAAEYWTGAGLQAALLGVPFVHGKLRTLRETAFGETPEATPQTPEPLATDVAQQQTQTIPVQPVEEVIPNAEQIQGATRPDVNVQLPGGASAREVYGGEMPADVGGEGVPPRGQGETLQQTPQEVVPTAPSEALAKEGVPQPEQPAVDPISAAAYKLPDGTVYTGRIHIEALRAAEDELGRTLNPSELQSGFVTKGGQFMNNAEAMRYATETKQIDKAEYDLQGKDVEGYISPSNLEAGRFNQVRKVPSEIQTTEKPTTISSEERTTTESEIPAQEIQTKSELVQPKGGEQLPQVGRPEEGGISETPKTQSDIVPSILRGETTVYHSTPAQFEHFDARFENSLGTHFGTQEQAGYVKSNISEGGRTIQAKIQLQNPLVLKQDLVFTDAPTLVGQLRDAGALTKEDISGLKPQLESVEKAQSTARFDDDPKLMKAQRAAMAEIKNVLVGKGYDGIVYPNFFERKGMQEPQMSYAVFDTSKIKQIKEPPPPATPPPVETPPTPAESPKGTGVSSQRFTEQYGEDAPVPNTGRSAGQLKEIGQTRLDNFQKTGDVKNDPYAVLTNLREGKVPVSQLADDVSLLRAEHQRLKNDAINAEGTPEWEAKSQASLDMAQAIKEVAHGPASDMMRSFQEYDKPRYDNVTDFDQALRERLGRESTSQERVKFKEMADDVTNTRNGAEEAINGAQKRLSKMPKMKFEDAYKSIHDQITELTKDCII